MRLPFVAALLVLAACSRTTEGTSPLLVGSINPRQRNVAPARVCNAQGGEQGWRVELLGERFTPIPQDVLTGEPTVGLPQVTLKGPVTFTLDRADVFYRDSTLLQVDIPTSDSTPPEALPPGNYAVEVKNPGGGASEVADLLIVVPPPTVTRVTAPQGFSFSGPSQLIVEGTGFRPDALPAMKLLREDGFEVEIFALSVNSSTRITTELPAGTPEGTYAFVLENPEGCAVTQLNAVTVAYARLGALTIEPRFGWQRRNQPITLYNTPTGSQRPFGEGAPEVWLVAPLKADPTQTVTIPLQRVASVSPSILNAVVPTCSGNAALPLTDDACPNGILAGGPYALRVADTSGALGEVPAANGFSVLENEPPVIEALSPSAIDTTGLDASKPLVVTGRNFGAGAKVQLLKQLGTGNILACDLPATGTASATSLSALVPRTIAAAQCAESTPTGDSVQASEGLQLDPGLFVVRVQNTADPAYANYSGLIVTNPAANPVHGPATNTQLATARADFPLVLATDDLGQPFLYALGGTDGTNTLASVEVAPVTLFGDVGGACTGTPCTFRTLERTPLGVGTQGDTPEPRRGLTAIVRTVPGDTSYLFVLGGVRGSDGNAVNTVERAQVLKVADAPALAPPERGTKEGTALPTGTFYYRVSAVLDGNDPENPNGETLPSDEYPVKTNEGLNTVTLTWRCVPGAAKYRIYRTATANESSGAERQLDEVAAPATPACTGTELPQVSYEDAGAKTPTEDAPRPLPPGALGRWVSLGTGLTVARGNAAARLVGDTVYVSGGCATAGGSCPSAAAALASIERATFTPNSMQLGNFAEAGAHTRARQRHSLAVANAATAPRSFTTPTDIRQDVWLLAVGGDQGGAPLTGTGIIEVAKVREDDAEVATPTFSAATYNTQGTHGGWTEVIADYLFQAGSTGGTGFKFGSAFVCRGTGNTPGQCDAPSQFDGTLDNALSGYQQGGPRYLAGTTLFRAFIYAAGGFPNDAGGTPTATLERIIY
ncbi:hypothetical protein [Hyalangium rubrum]|uniref:IPT/TIG domain-containing protein n=1 Tax=Hyalangium rubrum TaxID=3103134 RepID=A0ABU5HJS6_9BACT|nr:hypothetical protein [Hyalangium sp. s54d21]MDY7233098.1 hypothetical protein [Hyalangium sp. s54d21]